MPIHRAARFRALPCAITCRPYRALIMPPLRGGWIPACAGMTKMAGFIIELAFAGYSAAW
ncbi:MAG: hypothetical protein ACR2P4_09615 [Gammaproteobacteria bacterium]